MEGIPVLLRYRRALVHPCLHILSVFQSGSLPSRQNFIDFGICECKLPKQRVGLINFENLEHRVDSMNAVFLASATTRADRFTSELNLVLFPV